MAGHVKYAIFVRVNDKWRFESWLENSHAPAEELDGMRQMAELENGIGSFYSVAFIDYARAGKEGGADGNTRAPDLPDPEGHESGLTVVPVKRVDGE